MLFSSMVYEIKSGFALINNSCEQTHDMKHIIINRVKTIKSLPPLVIIDKIFIIISFFYKITRSDGISERTSFLCVAKIQKNNKKNETQYIFIKRTIICGLITICKFILPSCLFAEKE